MYGMRTPHQTTRKGLTTSPDVTRCQKLPPTRNGDIICVFLHLIHSFPTTIDTHVIILHGWSRLEVQDGSTEEKGGMTCSGRKMRENRQIFRAFGVKNGDLTKLRFLK